MIVNREFSRFDFRKIEDVIDDAEQQVSGFDNLPEGLSGVIRKVGIALPDLRQAKHTI